MKNTALGILFILLSICMFSQQNFEGVINYLGHSSQDSNSFGVDIYYGKGKMKVLNWETKEQNKKYTNQYRLYDFSKGISYVIRTNEQLILADSVNSLDTERVTKLEKTTEQKTILGYTCSKYLKKERLFGKDQTTDIWYADNISYTIAPKYQDGQSIIPTTTGNILWLALHMKFDLSDMASRSEKIKKIYIALINFEAEKITSQKLADSVFSIPASYKLVFRKIPDQEVTIEDIKLEEEKNEPPPPPPPPPPPKRPKLRTIKNN